MDVTDRFIDVDAKRLEVRMLNVPNATRTVVFLHEGLGSVALWGAFPGRLCETLGTNGLIYSRHGYGQSTRLGAPREIDFMAHEAEVVLPALLDALDLEQPVLFGHSDGASIALLNAARAPSHQALAAIVLAPHLFVEEISIAAIAAARSAYLEGDLRARLKRFHDDVDGAFFGWNDIWLDPAFSSWNIEAAVAKITCPLLAIQGEEDEYGTMAQIDAILERVAHARALKLARCRHSPHRDCSAEVIDACREFLDEL